MAEDPLDISVREEMPDVMKRRRGEGDLRRSGMKAKVMA